MAADDLVPAGIGDVIVIGTAIDRVSAAGVKVSRCRTAGIEPGIKADTVEGEPDQGCVRVRLRDFRRAAGDGVIVVAGMRIHMPAAVVERGDGVGTEDGSHGRRFVKLHPVERDPCSEKLRVSVPVRWPATGDQ